MRIRFWCSAAALCVCLPVFADQLAAPLRPSLRASPLRDRQLSVPETDEVRGRLREELYAPQPALGALRERVYTQEDGSRVQFRTQTQGGFLYYLFLRASAAGFPVAARGNYVIKKDPADGRFVQIKIFLRDHPECFVRLFPRGERSSLDVHLFGVQLYRDVSLAAPLESWLWEPFSRLRRLSGSLVDWDRLLEAGTLRGEPQTVGRIRAALSGLPDGEDGAMDETGRLVLIENGEPAPPGGGLNCSGFAKWVVDGFRLARRGGLLDIESLKVKHLNLRGNPWSLRHEEGRDPYFGLDWSRNLARSAWELEGLRTENLEEFDVRRSEFLRYREDVGYGPAELQLLLYLDAVENPGHYYLGSVNRDYGSEPSLRQHHHLVVLFPYFGLQGQFHVAVFDRNRESSIEKLHRQFPDSFVHLVRLPAGGEFIPPVPGAPTSR